MSLQLLAGDLNTVGGGLHWHHSICQTRHCNVYPLPVCLLCPASQPASLATMPGTVQILCPLLHTHPAWSGLMLGSLRPPPALTLPYWPLTEPKNPLTFAATLPPTVFGSCLVNLNSIQLRNPSERTEWNCRRKNTVCASPCLILSVWEHKATSCA